MGRATIVNLLLDMAAELNFLSHLNRKSNPLIYAISSLRNKVSPVYPDRLKNEEKIYKKFKLDIAQIYETIKILLEKAKKQNIDLINLQDVDGRTPLMWAITRSLEAVTYLLHLATKMQLNKDFNLKSVHEGTALELANDIKRELDDPDFTSLPDSNKRIANISKIIQYLNEEIQKKAGNKS